MDFNDWSMLEQGKLICSDDNFRLVDIGDGVVCFEITSKHQTLTVGLSNGILRSTNILNNNDEYKGMVIVSPIGKNFCVGANLNKVAEDHNNDTLMLTVDDIIMSQTAYMGIKYSRKPIIVAPSKRALGGGAEMCLAAARVVAAPNFMIGLVEANIGLIPAAGGCKEILIRCYENAGQDVAKAVKQAFKIVSKCFISKDADNAKTIGYLRPTDITDANPEDLVGDGKREVLALVADGYQPPKPASVHLASKAVYDEIVAELEQQKVEGSVGEHEFYVKSKIAKVMTADSFEDTIVYEYDILEKERMTFFDLASTEKTYARIDHMLKTGEKLNN